ncbi:type-1 angiotensin II receptor-associated protein isoform X5 [Caretta caretta]|uniref:type-1 angiotensin II receptor-associated protein isoform X5 n=1 Tax=Caretta caretta TaxID=8467 RepID=UPI0020960852|nr:type-1 angiotensin II receptor-associated protein isoform X4 [Caretta caretta]
MEVPAVNLKAIVLVHWLLTTWGCLGLPPSYAWGNFTVLAVGVWAIAQRESIDAIIMMYRERGGEYVVNLDLESSSDSRFTCDGFLSVGRDRSSYQSIDQQDAPCPYPDLDSKPAPHPF